MPYLQDFRHIMNGISRFSEVQAVGAHSNNEYLFVPSMTERAQLLAMCIMHLDEMQ